MVTATMGQCKICSVFTQLENTATKTCIGCDSDVRRLHGYIDKLEEQLASEKRVNKKLNDHIDSGAGAKSVLDRLRELPCSNSYEDYRNNVEEIINEYT